MTDADHDTRAHELRIGALFAGYGGLDLAVENVFGARTAWVSEFDKAPSTILAHRFPDAPNHGDVTQIDWTAVEPVDIITGGSPCQDLSHAGKRAGMKDGTRSGLWASMCNAIETIRPAFVVWENVRGAFSAEADSAVEYCPFCLGDERRCTLRALGRVLGDLAELGYDAAWCGVRASDIGAPHGRYRVFVLAWIAGDAANVDGGRSWEFGQLASRYPFGRADSDSRNGGGDGSRDGRGNDNAARRRGGPGGEDAPDAARRAEPEQLRVTGPADAGNDAPARYVGGGVDVALFDDETDESRLLPTPIAAADVWENMTPERWDEWRETERRAAGIGTSRLLSVEAQRLAVDFGPYEAAVRRWEMILGRPAPDPTEAHPKDESRRRLSPPFVEWMMGLPAGWVSDVPISRLDQLKALGNGVVPQQAAAALVHLLGVRELVYAAPECVCGAPMHSLACKLRGHTRGPRPAHETLPDIVGVSERPARVGGLPW